MFKEFSLVQRGSLSCAFCKESINDGDVLVINSTESGVLFVTHSQCPVVSERRKAIKDKIKYKELVDGIKS
ncbi:MAG: hypothetical protein U9O94_04025 [Nanoarchaeota archaeon]|nr:hypothetical protein [Nanoarchaeota archaeon]